MPSRDQGNVKTNIESTRSSSRATAAPTRRKQATAKGVCQAYVDALGRAWQAATGWSVQPATLIRLPKPDARQAPVLLVSPHPDDECLTGALPLRLRIEQRRRIVNVAATLGSQLERRGARHLELEAAARICGFQAIVPGSDGWAPLTCAARAAQPAAWRARAQHLAGLIRDLQANVIFMPHARDRHPTHVGAHWLALDALRLLGRGFTCLVVETEYWQPMARPNLVVESTPAQVATLVAALACHAGEVARNPYHWRLPGWMLDNARRGAELVPGAAAPVARWPFATLYQVSRWQRQQLHRLPPALAPAGASLPHFLVNKTQKQV